MAIGEAAAEGFAQGMGLARDALQTHSPSTAFRDLGKKLARIAQAEAWDEGHNHCFHVEDPNNPSGNPYRDSTD